MSEISGFFYCAKCGKNTSFCGMPKGSKNDHNTRGNNTEWKFKDNKWSIKNKYNGWGEFKIITNSDIQDYFCWCDNCFDEKPSFTDFIRDYPSIIINHPVDRINHLEKENLKIKLNEKENEIQKLKNENNYMNQIKKYENEIQTLKNNNNDLINKIKLLENNSNNSANNNNVPNNDKKTISSMGEIKIELNKYSFDLKKGEYLLPIIFQSVDSKIHYAIICKNTDRFNMIENILYDIYPEYIENENYFIVNGNKINKNKTIEQNNIKYSDIVILNTH